MAKPSAEDFLRHHGVLGMKWGSHKAVASVPSIKSQRKKFKDMTPEEQKKHQDKQGLITAGVIGGSYVALKAGSHFLAKHPEILARTANSIHGTKAIGVGYKTVQMIMKNGSYVLK